MQYYSCSAHSHSMLDAGVFEIKVSIESSDYVLLMVV